MILNDKNKEQKSGMSGALISQKASQYTLTIGENVEKLPANFFKSFGEAGQLVITDKSGNTCTVEMENKLSGTAPFSSITGECSIDELGALYEQTKKDGSRLSYIPTAISQYTLPSENVSINDYTNARVKATITYSLSMDSSDMTPDGDLPGFEKSGKVLVLGDTAEATVFGGNDLTGLSYTATDAEGRQYRVELAGWNCAGTEIALGASLPVENNDEIVLTAVWTVNPVSAAGSDEEAGTEKADEETAPVHSAESAAAAEAEEVAGQSSSVTEVTQTTESESATAAAAANTAESSEIIEAAEVENNKAAAAAQVKNAEPATAAEAAKTEAAAAKTVADVKFGNSVATDITPIIPESVKNTVVAFFNAPESEAEEIIDNAAPLAAYAESNIVESSENANGSDEASAPALSPAEIAETLPTVLWILPLFLILLMSLYFLADSEKKETV